MAIRKILKYPHDEAKLRAKSTNVRVFNKSIRRLIKDLKDTLVDSSGAGLAAPQIGVYERVALVRFGQDEGELRPPLVLVNPEIINASNPQKGFDGCLSIPDIITWDTVRPDSIEVTALDENGKHIQMKVSGIDARLVHHEIDHLDGILFLDRVEKVSDLYTIVETDEGEKAIRFDLLTSWLMTKDNSVRKIPVKNHNFG
jgi:peptide deformylase